jgi:hypothetical protein
VYTTHLVRLAVAGAIYVYANAVKTKTHFVTPLANDLRSSIFKLQQAAAWTSSLLHELP